MCILRWLIRFQGAQYCWDAASCELRRSNNHSQFLMTSRHAPEWISNMLPESPFVYPWMMKAFGVLNVVSHGHGWQLRLELWRP